MARNLLARYIVLIAWIFMSSGQLILLAIGGYKATGQLFWLDIIQSHKVTKVQGWQPALQSYNIIKMAQSCWL